MLDDNFYEELSRLVNGAFDNAFDRKPKPTTKKRKKTMNETEMQKEETPAPIHTVVPVGEVYESIEDYKAKTGKRFRMLKDQKERGLSREEAFNETYGG